MNEVGAVPPIWRLDDIVGRRQIFLMTYGPEYLFFLGVPETGKKTRIFSLTEKDLDTTDFCCPTIFS